MITIYNLKPKFQNLLRPCMLRLYRRGITPNQVTISALIGSICIGLAMTKCGECSSLMLLLIPVWMFIRMALNAVDGMMAREKDMASTRGAILNEIGDVVSDTLLYLPLGFVAPNAATAIVLFSVAAIMTEFAGVLGQALRASRQYQGPMGKSDRAFAVGLLTTVTAFSPTIIQYWGWVFLMLAMLCVITTVKRIQGAERELGQ